jgi:hypothetical protein
MYRLQASRKVLDDGAAAMRDGAKVRVLQGQKVLLKMGEHALPRHRYVSTARWLPLHQLFSKLPFLM